MSLVGKEIAALCTKCKLLLTHVVVSELDNVVSKVQCRTCGSVHKMRSAGKSRKPSGSSAAGVRKTGLKAVPQKTAPELLRQWEMKRGGLSADAEILEYRIDSVYRSGDVIMHAKFDLGFVQRVISEARIEVLFRGSLKLMAMNCKI